MTNTFQSVIVLLKGATSPASRSLISIFSDIEHCSNNTEATVNVIHRFWHGQKQQGGIKDEAEVMHPTEAVLNDVSSQNQISEDHHYAHQSKAKSNASTKGGHNRIFHLSVNRMDIGTMKAQMILSSKKLPSLSRQIALEF